MMKKLVVVCAILLVLGLVNIETTQADLGSVIQDGADRVVGLQYTDGKWGWPLNAPPTYDNITGPIGLGLLSAYGETGDITHLNSAESAGTSLVGMTSDWVGTYNPMFLIKLYDTTGTGSYLTQSQTFFSELDAGTYTRQSVDYATASWITLIQNARTGAWINLRPWEFAPQAYAASRAGSPAQVDAFVQAIKDGINTLDSSEAVDLLGLAGGVMGLGWMGEDFDPTAGAFAAADSTASMADMLVSYQNADGSWYWNSNISSPAIDDEDVQTTAYAMLALLAVNDSGQYNDEIILARNYLMGLQLGEGGWPSYPPSGQEYAEIDGEVLWALSETAPVPEPGAMILLSSLITGLFGTVGIRRRLRS